MILPSMMFFAISLFLPSSLAISPKTYVLEGGMQVKGFTNRTHLRLIVAFCADEWLGLGFGNDVMKDTYMIVMYYRNNTPTVHDFWSTGHKPMERIHDTWSVAKMRFVNETRVEFTIDRLINTGREKHFVFVDDLEYYFLYAHNTGDYPNYHGKKN